MQLAAPVILVSSAAGFAAILWSRSRFGPLPIASLAGWATAVLGIVAVVSVMIARRRFVSTTDAMVRLESELRLHNALNAAAAGCGTWPEVPSRVGDGWRWNWSRIAGPFAGGVAFIALALWIPISPEAANGLKVVEPQSWGQIESWLDKLEQEKIVTPDEKEEQKARIQHLRDQPQEKWFSHESLNASDTLKEQLQRDIQNLGKEFDQAARSLNAMEKYANQLSTAAKDQLLKDFDEAVSGLKSSPLEIEPELLKKLGQIDPKDIKSLSSDDMKALRDALKKNAGDCKGMGDKGFLGDGQGEDDELAEMEGLLKKQGGGPRKEGDSGDGPGNGGIDRGPGTAPLTLSDEENRLDTDKNQGIANTDMTRAQLGATLGIKDGKHEVDKTPVSPSNAGQVKSTGEGGSQVWRESLTPEEKAVLKKAFK